MSDKQDRKIFNIPVFSSKQADEESNTSNFSNEELSRINEQLVKTNTDLSSHNELLTTENDELRKKNEELVLQNAALNDRIMRLAADFDNFRKRQERELARLLEQDRNNMLGRIIDMRNEIFRALDAVEKDSDASAIYAGIRLLARRVEEILAQEGVAAEDVLGKSFDPLEHEAIAIIDVDDSTKDGVVVNIVEPCFKRDGKLVCPAKVVVGKFCK